MGFALQHRQLGKGIVGFDTSLHRTLITHKLEKREAVCQQRTQIRFNIMSKLIFILV